MLRKILRSPLKNDPPDHFYAASSPVYIKRKNKNDVFDAVFAFGAEYGARTRHIRLGKATLYHMS